MKIESSNLKGINSNYMRVSLVVLIIGLWTNSSILLFAKIPSSTSSMTMQEFNKLVDPDGAADDIFGYSVAVSGDTVIVGAPGHHSYTGVAYIYEYQRESNTFIKQASLSTSEGTANDFGKSVAISGDTVIVGAPEDNCDDGEYCGSVYLFEKPSSGWVNATENIKLTASERIDSNYFGYSVAISGDTVIVGVAIYGGAYLFEKPSGGWSTNMTENAKLNASDGVNFGYTVSISNDTVIVGAIGDDSNSGSVYLFEKPSSGWVDTNKSAKLTNSSAVAGGYFGISVAISNDTVIVGANMDSDTGYGYGSAYLFEKPSGGWNDMNQSAKLTASDGATGDSFGKSMAIREDTVIVGADTVNCIAGEHCGSAYLFEKPSGGWNDMNQSAKLTALDGAAGDSFGKSVAISGDTVVVGAIGDNSDSGSVYIFKEKVSQVVSPAIIMYLLN